MKKELEDKLFELGKDIIRPDPDLQQNLMVFGFECGDGWYELLYKLISDILATEPSEDFELFQAKEKYGELRVYTNCSTDEIENLIRVAEDTSITICEMCGAKAKTQKVRGWYHTICDKCLKEIKKR